MLGETILGTFATFWMFLHVYYKLGAVTLNVGYWAAGFGIEVFNQLDILLFYPHEANRMTEGFLLGGVVFAGFLMLMRFRFIW